MTAALLAGLAAGYAIAVPVGAVATYLIALTARTSLGTGAAAALGVATTDGAYASLVALTALNPATVVCFAALVVGLRAGAAPPARAEQLGFVLAVFVASASWQLLLAAGGALLGSRLTGPAGRRATALVSGAVIAALALRTALAG